MRIGGMQKVTYLDYPWKIATILFTVGCGFSCRFCYNKQFVIPEEIQKDAHNHIATEEVLEYLKSRKWLIDAVVMCGWEPTLQTDLAEFLNTIKIMWFLVKLDTNGTQPEIIQNLINQNLLDYIAMDIKDDFAWMDYLTQTTGKQEFLKKSIDIIMTSWLEYEFRTTVSKPYHTPEKIEAIASYIATRAKELSDDSSHWNSKPLKYAIQNFYPTENMIDPSFEAGKFTRAEMSELWAIANKYVKTEIRGLM